VVSEAARLPDELAAALDRLLPGRVRRQQPLGARTTYRVGGRAALWLEAQSEADLFAVHRALADMGRPVPVVVLGKGSNLLVADDGFPGLVLCLGGVFDEVSVDADRQLARAGGAVGLPVLARRTAAQGLRGLDWAVGVPGPVGGALRMNAGGHGAQTADVLERYRLFDLAVGAAQDHWAEDFQPGYRHSSVGDGKVVEWAEFALQPGQRRDAEALVSEIVRWRRLHQPGGSNAGSVFQNPAGRTAGELIERCGLKGRRLGSAEVSTKHANFIQADDGGSADDVRALMDLVRAEVAERTGMALVPEVHFVGFPDQELPMVDAGARAGGPAGSRRRADAPDVAGAGHPGLEGARSPSTFTRGRG